MPGVTLIVSEEFVQRVDAIVEERRAQQFSAVKRAPTPKEMEEALRIAKSKGKHAANAYLRSLNPPAPRVSRMGVVIELVEQALAQRPKPDKPKKKERRAEQPAQAAA
jgi:hypothetical protein